MIFFLVLISGLAFDGPSVQTGPIPQRYEQLWQANVRPLLERPVWRENTSRYDATHLLMVPLHAAFDLNESEWQRQFFEHFERFRLSGPPEQFSSADELAWLQYDYLVSEFLVLSARKGNPVPSGLADLLTRQVVSLWTVRPAWQWGHAPFPGMRSRLAWKLGVGRTAKSYYRAITDHEQYLFAIAADLVQYDRLTGKEDPSSRTLREILDTARAVYTQRVVFLPDSGWLFQPGVWADHPEYLYAGRERKVAGMSPAPLPDVAEDVSHSFRRPIWLLSLEGGARDSAEAKYYSDLRRKLDQQFFRHVLKPPVPAFPAYRLTNWMDGRNGVYRWNFSGRGSTWGYGPYQLSSTFTLGWWAFLGSPGIRSVYADELRRFPLSPTVLATYSPNLSDTNSVSPAISPDRLTDFRELLVYLASRLPPTLGSVPTGRGG
jgi:hypothetical protein